VVATPKMITTHIAAHPKPVHQQEHHQAV